GLSTQKAGVTAASLAGDLSSVIPVLFGCFIFQTADKTSPAGDYLGLIRTIPALARAPSVDRAAIRNQFLIGPMLYFLATGTNKTLINFLTSPFYAEGSNTLFMIIACLGAILIGTGLLMIQGLRNGKWPERQSVGAGLLLGIPNFLSLYFLLKALTHYGHSAAFVFPVYNILTILSSAVMAYWLYKEKLA